MIVINNIDETFTGCKTYTTLKRAEEDVGGLSNGSKMVVPSTGLPTDHCSVGSKLRLIEGSVCNDCYADKGFALVFKDNVSKARYRRLNALKNKSWVSAWVYIIKNKKVFKQEGVFRWQDSGDLQDKQHLDNILEVARQTPNVKHWIPTKESKLVKGLQDVPDNVVIRLSGSFIDGNPPNFTNTSTVTTEVEKVTCKASLPKGHLEKLDGCEDCRQCWDKNVSNVAYYKH